jgi:hypothetical protein
LAAFAAQQFSQQTESVMFLTLAMEWKLNKEADAKVRQTRARTGVLCCGRGFGDGMRVIATGCCVRRGMLRLGVESVEVSQQRSEPTRAGSGLALAVCRRLVKSFVRRAPLLRLLMLGALAVDVAKSFVELRCWFIVAETVDLGHCQVPLSSHRPAIQERQEAARLIVDDYVAPTGKHSAGVAATEKVLEHLCVLEGTIFHHNIDTLTHSALLPPPPIHSLSHGTSKVRSNALTRPLLRS